MCRQLQNGDEIVQIDGTTVKSKEEILPLLRGDDIPGSTVVVTVKKVRFENSFSNIQAHQKIPADRLSFHQKGNGNTQQVSLVRMPTEHIADRRKLFELFTELKTQAIKDNDMKAAAMTDSVIDLWTKMVVPYSTQRALLSDELIP